MDILPGPGIIQPAPTAPPPALPVSGPAAPAAPIEPARRVTANREGGQGDLQTEQQTQKTHQPPRSRGRLLDLFV
jgi:hypothetical protein